MHSDVRLAAVAEQGSEAERVAAVIFTSGTTGRPKGVMLTHDALLHYARVSCEARGLGRDDRLAAFVPMTHILGLGAVLASSLYSGATLVLRQAFSAADVLDALAPVPTISLHPDDAQRLGAVHGGVLRVESHHGAIEGVADVTRAVNPGHLFVPFAYWEAAANKLTGSALDAFGKIPGFKVTAVRAFALPA